jgi:hypothetical protein
VVEHRQKSLLVIGLCSRTKTYFIFPLLDLTVASGFLCGNASGEVLLV